MNPITSLDLKRLAGEAGFAYCGVAVARYLAGEKDHYDTWLADHRYGIMEYLRRNYPGRLDPREVMPGARSVISLLYSYYPTQKPAEEGNYILAKYAYGSDYHVLIRKRLDQVIDGIHKLAPEAVCQPFCDSGVLMEKAWGQQCGVGWRGKNTILINKTGGSFFFIGVILTDLEPEPDRPEPDRCGNCHKCMDACPTGALEQPHVLNPLKCIAYHTIEERKEIPAEIASQLSNRIYGCDICQDVCPFNRAPAPTREPLFEPHPRLLTMDRAGWETLSKEDFDEIFRGTPVARAGYEKLMNNIRQAGENRH